tara:strand:- start:148 stop:564 length:417 start_codon:yes stop_codon:yes gene_type:complete
MAKKKVSKRTSVSKRTPEEVVAKKDLSLMIQERFPPQVIGDKIQELLDAKKIVRDPRTGETLDELPDVQAISKGLEFALHYGTGLPVKRVEQVKVTLGGKKLAEMAAKSPRFRQAMAKMHDRLQATKTIEAEEMTDQK